jgi:hydroxymethylpyrimidine pyrophosphatase-like HAD family hydrolase
VQVERFDNAFDQTGKIVAVGDDPDLLDQCKIAMDAALAHSVSASRSQSYFLDVTHIDANKGRLIEILSQLLSIPFDQIAVIGDGWNDMLMFGKSGLRRLRQGRRSDFA